MYRYVRDTWSELFSQMHPTHPFIQLTVNKFLHNRKKRRDAKAPHLSNV